MVVVVGARLAVIKMWWRDPFGGAVEQLSRCLALLQQLVMRPAGKGQVVDVGAPTGGEFSTWCTSHRYPGTVQPGLCAATIAGMQHNPLPWTGDAGLAQIQRHLVCLSNTAR